MSECSPTAVVNRLACRIKAFERIRQTSDDKEVGERGVWMDGSICMGTDCEDICIPYEGSPKDIHLIMARLTKGHHLRALVSFSSHHHVNSTQNGAIMAGMEVIHELNKMDPLVVRLTLTAAVAEILI